MNKLLNPQVSIILPIYNSEEFLEECLDSILNQTFEDFEIIAINDGSTDKTLTILKKYRIADQRLKIIDSKVNEGVARAMNKGLKIAKGKYIAIMNSDDIMYRDRIKKQYNYLKNHTFNILVGGQVRMINKAGRFIRDKQFPTENIEIKQLLYLTNPIQHSSMMINSSLLPKDFDWYDETYEVSEDLALLFKLINYGEFSNLNDFLISYRVHNESYCRKDPKKMFELAYKARLLGSKIYGYTPTFKDKLLLNTANIIIKIIPSNLIFPIFYKIRQNLMKRDSKQGNNSAFMMSYEIR